MVFLAVRFILNRWGRRDSQATVCLEYELTFAQGSSHNVAMATLYQVCLIPYGITLLAQRHKLALGKPLVCVGSRTASAVHKKQKHHVCGAFAFYGADYGARTRHLRLGKATLYQMS